jgi:hypothetical protein
MGNRGYVMFLAYSHTIPHVSSEISVVIDKSTKQKNTNFARLPAHLTFYKKKRLQKVAVFLKHSHTKFSRRYLSLSGSTEQGN